MAVPTVPVSPVYTSACPPQIPPCEKDIIIPMVRY